jgi:predicted MFS family arabinose efflux permease
VFARALAGFFGGIVGGISLAMVGDLVPDARRASAVGAVMSAFSVAQVAGVPLGLSVEPEHRGGFMSVNSAVAQFSAALAATMAALVIHDGANHRLVGFGKVAWLYVGWAVIGLWLASGIRRAAVPTACPVA